MSSPTLAAISFLGSFSSIFKEEAEASVLPFRSSITCAYICLLLRKTDRRGHSAVPLILPRTRAFIFSLFSFFVIIAMSVYLNYLPAVLPDLRRSCSPTNLIPLPLYGSGLRNERILAHTCPSNCLSQDSRMMSGFLFLSILVSTLISSGNCRKMLWV